MKTTKELARELGLIRKRSASTQDKNIRKIRKTNQIFSYLVVIDFESTCWENEKYRAQEIIEFPAVLLNTNTGEIEAEFQHYVQPQENPVLSDFCTQLTGITQGQVEAGIPLHIVTRRFSQWLKTLSQEKSICYNVESDAHVHRCTFVTWSDWDLGVCLQYECRRKQIRKPAELGSWIDLRATYRTFYSRKPQGLNGALKDVGIEFEGREHSGLHDARNTARLAWRMMCDGCVMQITKTLPGSNSSAVSRQTCTEKSKVAYTALRPPPVVQDTEARPSTSGVPQASTSTKGVPEKKQLGPPRTGDHISRTTLSNSSTIQSHGKAQINIFCDPPKRSPSKSTPIQRHCILNLRTPTPRGLTDTTNVKRNAPSSSGGSAFKPPGSVLVKATPDSSSRSFITPQNGPGSSNMKRTPPLCSCGKRSKRKVVQTPGPNVGRFFFCCPAGRSGGSCRFFKWEAAIQSPSMLTPQNASVGQQRNFIIPPPAQPNFDTPRPEVTAIKTKTLGMERLKPVLALR